MSFPKKGKYTALQSLSVSAVMLPEFRIHRRMKVYAAKGCTCVKCGVKATELIQWHPYHFNTQLHWDLRTDDGRMITVDHIIPKAMGGPDELWNYQPMCNSCNNTKGHNPPKFKTGCGFDATVVYYHAGSDYPIGVLVHSPVFKPELLWYNTEGRLKRPRSVWVDKDLDIKGGFSNGN